MRIRVLESGSLDIFTIQELLLNADRQANFHPDSRWILSSKLKTEAVSSKKELSVLDLQVKWIGREAVVVWLTSNQVLFHVLSYALLKEEKEALETAYEEHIYPENPSKLN